MSEEELDSLVKDMNDLRENKQIIPFDTDVKALFKKHGITFEELRKI
jgi:hypothetical protein